MSYTRNERDILNKLTTNIMFNLSEIANEFSVIKNFDLLFKIQRNLKDDIIVFNAHTKFTSAIIIIHSFEHKTEKNAEISIVSKFFIEVSSETVNLRQFNHASLIKSSKNFYYFF